MNPWNNPDYTYSVIMINSGSNPLSKLEIVSTLNSFNFAYFQLHYNGPTCMPKYNPKVYLGAVQTVAENWNYDYQPGQTNPLPWLPGGGQKSGSWPV